MAGESKFKSFCMVALLVAEATQAVTPDIASLASTRLFLIVATIAERGESGDTYRLQPGCLTTHNANSPAPNGSLPLEDRSEESAPDEICLASYRLGFELELNETGKSHKAPDVPFELEMPPMHAGRRGSSCAFGPVPCTSGLIHSLCRMTC
jgi:hypothetical protein